MNEINELNAQATQTTENEQTKSEQTKSEQTKSEQTEVENTASEQTAFADLKMHPDIKRAIEEMGFTHATSIQSRAIPMIQSGADVIGRSQTGTGKTLAFGVPALEAIDTTDERNPLQVMIICPTRELAQQACEEIKKLSAYLHGIRAVEVYGGVPMDRQILRLKRANIVIGTPGRIMDHMRRRTIKVNHLKMIVLDEADEMLSMGFKEDIETILTDTPAERQTILFSATMPPAILAITREFQNDPQMIEIDRKRITLENIGQYYIDAPMGRKLDVLNLVMRYHQPKLSMIFCNTKKMVEDVTEFLCKQGFAAEGLHGDMKQSQRSKVMDGFKAGRITILVATDVAARGIDVDGIDYVINYDVPQNNEYYVHRIGRTGRAGKSGKAITICSGRRQVYTLRDIARMTKSTLEELSIPTLSDVKEKTGTLNLDQVRKAISEEAGEANLGIVKQLIEEGFSAEQVAAAALLLNFGHEEELEIEEIKTFGKKTGNIGGGYSRIQLDIGRGNRVAPNHIVGAITERTGLNGGEIGKIEIFDDKTIVGVPSGRLDDIVLAMIGCKVCGRPTVTVALPGAGQERDSRGGRPFGGQGGGRGNFRGGSSGRFDKSRSGSRPERREKYDKPNSYESKHRKG